MKWFKHYVDASRGDLLGKINREFGLQGEARWWRLIELMSERYPTDDGSFRFTSEILRRYMSFRSEIDLGYFLDRLQIHSGLIVNRSGNDYELVYCKISELRDNHTKNLQVAGKLVSRKLPQDKIRTDKIRTDKIRTDKKGLLVLWSDDPRPVERVLDYLNKKVSKKFGARNMDSVKKITRLARKYGPEDFQKVIDYKTAEWLGNEKMKVHLVPSTLFGEKFESYLEMANNNPLPEKTNITDFSLQELGDLLIGLNNENTK